MIEEPSVKPCSRCLTPLGSDAIMLKNGLAMCPACFQRSYPIKPKTSEGSRFYVSVEGVLAVLLTVGGFFGCYTLYKNHVESERLALIEKKEAEAKADQRYKDDLARQKEASERAEADRKAYDAKRDAERKAQILASEAERKRQKDEEDRKQAEQDARNKAEQIRQDNELRVQQLLKDREDALAREKELKEIRANKASRDAEIAKLTVEVAHLEKEIAPMEAKFIENQRSAKINQVIFDTKSKALKDALKQYKMSNYQYSALPWDTEWTGKMFDSVKIVGGTTVTQ